MATGELRRDHRPDPIDGPELQLGAEEQANYDVFWREFPGGLRVIPLDNSGDIQTDEREAWFVQAESRGRPRHFN